MSRSFNTIPQTLKRLGGVSRSTFYAKAREGKIKIIQVLGRSGCTDDEIERVIAQGEADADAKAEARASGRRAA